MSRKESTMRYVTEEVLEQMFGVDTGIPPTLLLATDGSPSSGGAAAYAAGLARRLRGMVVVVHVVGDGEDMGRGESIIGDAKAIVEEWGVRCDTILSDGEVHRAIGWVAEEVEAECVILGDRRAGRNSPELAGKIMQMSGIPVVAVGTGWMSLSIVEPES